MWGLCVAQELQNLASADFNYLHGFFKRKSGYVLEQGREFICASCLSGLMHHYGISDLSDVVAKLRQEPEGNFAQSVVEAMTINETMFFRDQLPFQYLAQSILPRLAAGRSPGQISIWSTACSSGQEPYSIAMLLEKEKFNYPGWRFSIIGSDISGEMIEKAEAGIYTDFEVERGLTPELISEFMIRDGERWRVNNTIKSTVTFNKVNLLDIPASTGVFDVIFCRNVMIYFEENQKKEILRNLRNHVRTGGFMVMGVSEKLPAGVNEFKPLENLNGVYIAA